MAPPNIVFELVEHPTEEIAEEAKKLFADLMVADPAAVALTGGNVSLIPDLSHVMIRPLALCPGVGQLFTARDASASTSANANGHGNGEGEGEGALVGFALFSLPGQRMLSTPEQQAYGLFELMGKLSPEGQAYYAGTMGTDVPAANDEVLGIADVERTAYWCNFAMVRADYQGRGVARGLFARAFEEADKRGATVALTTTNIRNVPIYEKLGFKLYGKRVMPSPWVDWPIWFFARAPPGSGSGSGSGQAEPHGHGQAQGEGQGKEEGQAHRSRWAAFTSSWRRAFGW